MLNDTVQFSLTYLTIFLSDHHFRYQVTLVLSPGDSRRMRTLSTDAVRTRRKHTPSCYMR